jgi:hypothetical protein
MEKAQPRSRFLAGVVGNGRPAVNRSRSRYLKITRAESALLRAENRLSKLALSRARLPDVSRRQQHAGRTLQEVGWGELRALLPTTPPSADAVSQNQARACVKTILII